MATAVETKTRPAEGERRFVIYNVGWDGYQTLLTLVGHRAIRLTYDRGNVELMSPLFIHERFKSLLKLVVVTITDELNIPRISAGSTTFHRHDSDRGLEPDECFYLGNLQRVHNSDRIDLDIDPPPDLAIEVDITSSSLDRLGIYATLKIPEVWRFDAETLSILLLGADGSYVRSETSAVFPFLPMSEVARFLLEVDSADETRWGREFRAWVRDVLAARFQNEAEPE